MKNTYNKRTIINVLSYLIWILPLCVLVTGCNFEKPDINNSNSFSDTQNYNRREELAILKAQSSHTVSIDNLSVMVDGVLNTKNESRNVNDAAPLAISEVKKLPALTKNKFINRIKGTRSLTTQSEDEQIELYNFVIANPDNENPGFVLTSNDIRIGFILAIVENGDVENNDNPFTDIFNTGLVNYIEETIILYNDISPEEIDSALEKWYDTEPEARSLTSRWMGDEWQATGYESDFNRVVPAQIKTEWKQREPYNEYVNFERTAAQGAPNISYLAGCGPVAAAQLIAYYGYIPDTYKPNNFTINSGTLSEVNWVKAGGYHFSNLTSQSQIPDSSSNSATADIKAKEAALRGEVAALMYQLGKIFGAKYYKNGHTSTTHSNIASNFINDLGYKTDYPYFIKATVFTESGSSFSITYKNDSKYRVITQLSKSKPRPIIFCGIRTDNDGEEHGHVWLVDGYGTISYYTESLKNTTTGQIYTYPLNLNNCIMVHCNLGWGGTGDGWYIYGLFDTTHKSMIPRNILSIGIIDYSYDVLMFTPYH